jgi:DNA polymerase epsilon subunit 3
MDPEAEFGLPVASITRIVKARLPDGVQVGREAKLAFSKAAGIFVLYLTSCALDICKESKRSTISAADIFAALEEVDFEEYKEPLRVFLNKYREDQEAKRAEQVAVVTDANKTAASSSASPPPAPSSTKEASNGTKESTAASVESSGMDIA